MSRHLYMVGEEVVFGRHSGTFSPRAGGTYTIKAQLPPLGDHLQYRIKSATEPHERVVVEHQLSAGEPGAAAGFRDAGASAFVAEKTGPITELERNAVRRHVSLAPIRGLTA